MKLYSEVTPALLAQAEQELFDIIFQQRSAFNLRWRNSAFYRRSRPILRMAGMALSLLGAAIVIYALLATPTWCPAYPFAVGVLLLFVGFFALFYFLPVLEQRLQIQLDRILVNTCRRQATKCIAAARQQAPFTAEYTLENGKITYSRIKDSKHSAVWTRKLGGVAFHRQHATLLYQKPTSFVARIVILHEEFAPMAAALKEQGVEIIN